MLKPKSDESLIDFQPPPDWREIDLGTRIDRNGETTYHVLSSEGKSGVFFEKIFDQDHKLMRIQKRSATSRSETHFDTVSGAITRIFESSTLSDGSSMMKDIIYDEADKSCESVTVIAPNGELVRRVEREHLGTRAIFQGQTEYNAEGRPAATVNHHMDPLTGHLVRREQIQWRDEHHRSLTENFLFNYAGILVRYIKTLYHAGAGPFLEEIQEYDPQSQSMVKREIFGYNTAGDQTCLDTITYSESGLILERKTIFFDGSGQPVATRHSSP